VSPVLTRLSAVAVKPVQVVLSLEPQVQATALPVVRVELHLQADAFQHIGLSPLMVQAAPSEVHFPAKVVLPVVVLPEGWVPVPEQVLAPEPFVAAAVLLVQVPEPVQAEKRLLVLAVQREQAVERIQVPEPALVVVRVQVPEPVQVFVLVMVAEPVLAELPVWAPAAAGLR